MPEQYSQLLSELKEFIPSVRIYTDELRTLGWGTDASFYRMIPKIVVQTDNEREVSRIVSACARRKIPFTFRAAGTSLSGQSVSDSVLIVAGKHWEKYTLSADAGTITMQPGLTGGRVNRILKPLGRVLPPDPASVNSAMVGGIVVNNASGMNCGVHANSDHTLISARLILADGTVLDTGNAESREAFRKSHPDFIRQIEQLRDKVRANQKLTELIHYKYSIKNVTGLNLRPLVDYDDPFDIIAHSVVGSEGTLAFLSEFKMKTLHEYPFRASAMVYFLNMKESCNAVVAMKKLLSDEGDLKMSMERLMVKSAEMLDYKSLASVDDPVYLQYQKDVDAGKIPGVEKGDYHNLTAILTETKATTHEGLEQNIKTITETLQQFPLYIPVEFTDDPKVYGKYWAIRSGIFPSVGGMRPVGTSCLIEDVAFHIEDLPEATVKLQKLLADHGYDDACIYGHAFEGNYHFILNQSFESEAEVKRYADMMHEVARLVIDEYHGSLKAEQGTGRNMAPFVKYEWGEDAYEAMKALKQIFDPQHLLNPGVIFNDDPNCFIEHLKFLPKLDFDFSKLPDADKYLAQLGAAKSSIQEMIEGVKRANKCIECGFCEINCLSCGLTLSSRMRIVAQREILRLRHEATPEALARAERLTKQYRYLGNQTCATDGLCATSCPMKINTGDLTHLIRQQQMDKSPLLRDIGNDAAKHLGEVEDALKLTLELADLGHSVLGTKAMSSVCKSLHKAGVPLWTPSMPRANRVDASKLVSQKLHDGKPSTTLNSKLLTLNSQKVVYFPSCLNQTMGLQKNAPVKRTVIEEMVNLCRKAGYEVIFPEKMKGLCCGQIWESKGMMDIADRKSAELFEALWKASEQGKYPIVCDQSPCLHRMRKMMPKLHLYEPAEFILEFLKPHLTFHQLHRSVAVHITCSMREMGLGDRLVELARMCADEVLVPEGVGCCGFAGDRGFTHPEMNRYALRKLRPQVEEHHVVAGYSNSRTCEIGLETNSGVPYMSIAYLVNEATEASPIPLQ